MADGSATRDVVADAIRDVTAAVLARYADRASVRVSEKAPGDLVTEVDTALETALTAALRDIEPLPVLGEEAAAADPQLLAQSWDRDRVWVVDPIDGTSNFAAGSDAFGVMVALLDTGRTVASWIHHPIAGTMFAARHCAGAWRDDTPLPATATASATTGATVPATDTAELRGCVPVTYLGDELRAHFAGGGARVASTTHTSRCAAFDYPAMAEGRQDFAMFWRVLPWDHLPGALLLTEAGGRVARYDGTPYTSGPLRTGLLCAAPGIDWHSVRDALLPVAWHTH